MNDLNLQWIKTDIDGNGERWLLSFECDGKTIFPIEDFEDDTALYVDELRHPVLTPAQIIEQKDAEMRKFKNLVSLARAVCKTASGTYNDNRSSVDKKKLSALSKYIFGGDDDE